MTTPTVPVTVNVGQPGVVVRAKMSGPDVYSGGIVLPQTVEATSDASGNAVLQCFPTAPVPLGLGSAGVVTSFTASIPGGRGFNITAQVPNRACALHEIASIAPTASVEVQRINLLRAVEVYQTAAALLAEANTATLDLVDGPTVNWDMRAGRNARLTLGAVTGRTIANPTNQLSTSGHLVLVQDSVGGRTITTWGSKYRFTSASGAPVLSTAPNSRDILSYFSDGSLIYLSEFQMGATIAGVEGNPPAPPPPAPPAPAPAPTTPTTPTAQTIQAEDMELEGTLHFENNAYTGYQGTGYVVFFNSPSDKATARFPGVVAGSYDITLGYARATPNNNYVSINGVESSVAFPATSGSAFGTLTIPSKSLNAGTNVISVRMGDGSFPLDRITITPVTTTAPPPPPAPTPAPAPVVAGGTGYAFGSRAQAISVSHIKPTNVSTAQMDATVKSVYDRWKAARIQDADYIVPGGKVDTYGGNVLYVSEGIGMAMVMAVTMAGHDTGAQALFNGLHKVAAALPAYAVTGAAGASVGNYLMNWRVGVGGAPDASSGGGDGWAAADGDLDRALALLMAHKQWGSSGSINYLQDARNVIAAIKSWFMYPDGRLRTRPVENMMRTSDVMLQHFQAFYNATGDSFWLTAKEANLAVLERFVSSYSPTYAIIPDEILGSNANPPDAPNFNAPVHLDYKATSATMFANAQRNPWRLGTAYLYESDATMRARIKSLCDKWTNFIKADTQGYPERTATGYAVDGSLNGVAGTLFRPYTSGWYPWGMIGPQLCAAMVDSSHQTYLNALWACNRDYFNTDYYNGELQFIPMLVASGNWWTP